MRVTNARDLDRLLELAGGTQAGRISPAQRQLKQALAEFEAEQRSPAPCPIRKAKKAVSVESQGEAYVRIALIAAFGSWEAGGEVVAELIPFSDRNYRTDFALPRFRVAVEVDGWSHHGRFLDDHNSDRERGLHFARHDWLVIRVGHGQAKTLAGELVECISDVMKIREPVSRESVQMVKAGSGRWSRLVAQNNDNLD